MAFSAKVVYAFVFLLICRASAAPLSSSNNADPICSGAQLIAPGQSSLVYKYTTEVKLSVANSQFDLKSEISADVNIKGLGGCNYALQLRNVKVTETQDEDVRKVQSSTAAQRELEGLVVRFRWADGFVIAVEADKSAKVDHVNFIKGVLSALQVYSPVPKDGSNIVREEDVLGVCTTHYKYSQKGAVTQVTKVKDLSTCSKDKLHLSSSPVLTSLLGPIVEEAFNVKTRYVCQTTINNKKVQSVKCKTFETDSEADDKPASGSQADGHVHGDDSSSEEDVEDFDFDKDDEISSKLVAVKQELTLQSGASANVDTNAISNPIRQTLQFVPTASFDKSGQTVAELVKKLDDLLKSNNWDQLAAARFVEVANELRRMDKSNIDSFKSKSGLKNLVPTLLNTIYAHDPSASLLNLDSSTLKFSNPMSVFYLENPSDELVDQVVQGANRLTAEQVPEFVGLAATILKAYRTREDNHNAAEKKIKSFQQAINRFLSGNDDEVTTAVLSAYAQLGLYSSQVQQLAGNDKASLPVQYHALNVIRNIREENIGENDQLTIRKNLQNLLLRKLQNTDNSNAVRIWSFEALFTPFIYNPETDESSLGDDLEKALGEIVNQPLNQVNGFIWSALKYSALDRLCPLRGLAARLRAHHPNKGQFAKQATLSSRQIQVQLPLRQNYEAAIQLCVVFENNRVVPSFIGAKLAFDGIRRETLRLPWVDLALINENIDENFAEYLFNLDPLIKNKNVDDKYRQQTKNNLPPGPKKLQEAYENKKESADEPDSSVHLYLKLFGADFRAKDVTDKVQDLLKSNVRTYLRNKLLNKLKELSENNPTFRLPLEIGAATAAANGLTLYKSAQLGLLADISSKLTDTRDTNGLGIFSLASQSALSFSLTFQREIASPLTTIAESVSFGGFSNVPFEYNANANSQGRIREFNLLNPQSTLLATDFEYSIRTSKGFENIANFQGKKIDPSCTPSFVYRGLGLKACLEMNVFRSITLGSRPTYPLTITVQKDPSIKKWRIGWRFNAQDAPQYEVAVEKVGASGTYPGLGISVTKTGNNFNAKVLTGMKSFTVKGTQSGDKFTGTVYSNENKEVMTASGTLVVNDNQFKLDTKLTDSGTKKEVALLSADILPNRGKGLSADIELSTPDKKKSFKVNFRGDLYKPDSKLVHIDGSFNLGDTTYTGRAHVELGEKSSKIELHRTLKLGKSGSTNGYELLYKRTKTTDATQNKTEINAHLSTQVPNRDQPLKLINLQGSFSRANDLSNAKLDGTLDFLLLTRNPPVPEQIRLDYTRESFRAASQARRLVSPSANLKLQLTTKSNVFNFLLDHKHKRSTESAKKGPETLPPTLDIKNKIHLAADTDKLLPDIPRPFAFDFQSDLDFELLNKVDYKFQYNLRRREQSGLFKYNSQVNKVTDGHLYAGTSTTELLWDNKQKTAKATGNFVICTKSRSLKTHWDIDTNLVADKNDAQLDLNIRFDRQPKPNAPVSTIAVYNITLNAPKHELFQLIDIDGNLTRQEGLLETYNSIAYRTDGGLKEFVVNALVDRNHTGDGSLQAHLGLSLPFKYLPYITYDLIFQRPTPSGRVNHIGSQLIAKPVLAHYAQIDIDRSNADQPPKVHVDNEFEYLRGNGASLYGQSKIDVHRWSVLHSSGLLKRNTDVLHRHSIGYIFTAKTRKVALSLESPQLSGNPLSIIGELTIDRENRIGKMKWPQEFAVHLEFGTPLSNLTAVQLSYNLPLFNANDQQTVDATVGFKLASSKITPISFSLQTEGSLSTTLHATQSLSVGDDIALNTLLTAQYHQQDISQISLSTSSKYYTQEFQNSLYALKKNHQLIVRGILNTTDNEDIQYEMDIGFDENLLTGHTERSNGQQVVTSDIEAKQCSSTGKYKRCYKGDITVRSAANSPPRKGSFDVSWGLGVAELNVKVPNGIDISFDHQHTGRLRDDDFQSQTNINGKLLQSDNRAGFTYKGSVEKENGQWKTVSFQSSATDKQTGQKSFSTDISLDQKVTDKLTGKLQRKIQVNFERKGASILSWSSNSDSCLRDHSEVLYGICQTGKFEAKLNNQFAQRLRQRLQLPADSKLSNPAGQVTYDGTFKLDLKPNTQSGPHEFTVDLNRLKEDAVDLEVKFQPRVDTQPMNLALKANLPGQRNISVKYDETRDSATKFNGVLKYSFNSNDASAEKTYKCTVDHPSVDAVSATCDGERTKLTVDIDRKVGKSKVYVDLKKYQGQRVGFEGVRNPQTKELDATLYTFVSSWNVKRQPGRSLTLTVRQDNNVVFSAQGTKVNNQQIQVQFSPSNVKLQLDWDNSTVVTLKQTSPEAKNIVSLTIDRAQIRPYLPSLRNQNRPAHDIDQAASKSGKPLFELTLDSHTVIAVSQALDKLGSHNGHYGLDTIKKAFRLQIGDAPLTIYNTQHWKTHREDSHLPESYSLRIVNNANGNFIQLTNNRWNENRLIAKVSHSFDGGQTLTTDLKVNRDYAHQVGSVYFFDSVGYRNVQGVKQLRNFTRNFVRSHLRQDLDKTNLVQLVKKLRERLRSVIEKDYAAVKTIATAWSQEPENSFLRRFSARLGLLEFFKKYPTYTEASQRLTATLYERANEREQFWRDRFESILNENRLKGLSERFQVRRTALIKRLSDRANKFLDRYLPEVDQSTIDKRIADYANKLVNSFEQAIKRNAEQMKAIFKAIDDATKSDDTKWFRTLVADIDSAAFAANVDAEISQTITKLGASSKLFINNIQQISKRLTKRRENIRNRVKNAIRHLPNAYINETNFHLLFPIGRQPGSYSSANELLLAAGSLLRNRDQAFDTIRSILSTRLDARSETFANYYKALRSLAKRLLRRNPSLVPESKAIIASTGDGIDLNGNYIDLNPSCNYALAQDFEDLQFAFGFIQGKVYSLIPSSLEVKEFECSNTDRVVACHHGTHYLINVPMHYGGRVNGALGDVADRSGKAPSDLSKWLLRPCTSTAASDVQSIPACANPDEDKQKFCENYVAKASKTSGDQRKAIAEALEALNQLN